LDIARLSTALAPASSPTAKERDVKRKTSPNQDEVVRAVLSRASNARRLATQFTAAVGDPWEANFPEVCTGGFVSFKDLRLFYKDYEFADLGLLQGRVSAKRMKALKEGAALTSGEKALYTKRKLAAYFDEPVEGEIYSISAVTSSSGRTAYWTEIRYGYLSIHRELLGIFPTWTAAENAVRRKGLISARQYRPRSHARRTTRRHNR
jgi:hypothetical protein